MKRFVDQLTKVIEVITSIGCCDDDNVWLRNEVDQAIVWRKQSID